MLKFRLIPLLPFLLAVPVQADIYKHIDANGNITFTNAPMAGAQRIIVEQSRQVPRPAAKARTGAESSRSAAPSPPAFPRVDSSSQKERDVNRRRILEEELASEQRLLTERKKELTEAESNRSAQERANPAKYVARIGQLRENMTLHEKNIAALQAEISKIR